MHRREFRSLAIGSLDQFVFGHAPHPVTCRRGVVCGAGTVIPEVNFTLPSLEITERTWREVRSHYSEMIEGVCHRAAELEVPALLVELETLPPMTLKPQWGADITSLLADALHSHAEKDGVKYALRLTPNDNRDHGRPILMRQGEYWENMIQLFRRAAAAGADLLAIESTGGKEISDEALMSGNLRAIVFALGVLGARDMEFAWTHIVRICEETGIIASGDSACGFGNTAMVLAEQKMIPRVLAAVVRVATVPRSLVAYECGARGPSKDCAYEGPYLKAIAGVPISMEGRTAACAHLSRVGNIAQAVCDCWSNESVQNVRLLSGPAPTVSLEQLAYDCRLLNVAGRDLDGARQMRDWLVESDAAHDPQAYVLRPDVVLRISRQIIEERTAYARTRRAVLAALEELTKAQQTGAVRIIPRELRWLDSLRKQADALPEREEDLTAEFIGAVRNTDFIPAEYELVG